ncbi:unnamed protein product [Symbiodinium natans]|uniref:Uncharacterized protein n=1 Tax=Symbiodinium natans TaxID=878477 RepID=A0A812PHP0_9DINO|nr:unnamed protein product [Symbiodinium natans]
MPYASALVMSLISFAGVGLLVFLQIPRFGAVVEYCCLAFAATVLVADALIHLLPHALEGADHDTMSAVGVSATVGCLAILAIPEVCEWRHQHHDHHEGAQHGTQVAASMHSAVSIPRSMLTAGPISSQRCSTTSWME